MSRNFIDWNGSGGLDSQDLVTGVALDVAKDQEDESESEQSSSSYQPNPVQQSGGCCMTAITLALIVIGLMVAIIA